MSNNNKWVDWKAINQKKREKRELEQKIKQNKTQIAIEKSKLKAILDLTC